MSESAFRQATELVRGGLERSQWDETSEALILTSGFVYGSAEEAEAAFAGEADRYIYSRYGNPTVSTFQERIRLIVGAEACYATSSGMSAVFTSLIALLEQGDRVVASRGLFGSCFLILDELLPRWGIETTFVDGGNLAGWEEALNDGAKAVFFETPSNPMQALVDIEAVSKLAHAAGATVVVDNVFATPMLQKPLEMLPFHVAARLHRRMHVVLLALLEELRDECMLRGGLTTTHGDSTPRPPVERTVLVDLPEKFLGCHLASHELQGLVGAGFGTQAAAGAELSVDLQALLFGKRDRIGRAGLDTGSARLAVELDVEDLGGPLP